MRESAGLRKMGCKPWSRESENPMNQEPVRKPKSHHLEIWIVVAIVSGALIGVSLQFGDPWYWVQERWPGSPLRAFDDAIQEVSTRQGVDPALVKAMIWQGSRFEPKARGPGGERGLMQVPESAGIAWAEANGVEIFSAVDLFDPATNLEAGVWNLERALRNHSEKEDPIPFALAEFRNGPEQVRAWIGEENEGVLSAEEFKERVDFPGTFFYIENIEARWKYYRNRGEFGAPMRSSGS